MNDCLCSSFRLACPKTSAFQPLPFTIAFMSAVLLATVVFQNWLLILLTKWISYFGFKWSKIWQARLPCSGPVMAVAWPDNAKNAMKMAVMWIFLEKWWWFIGQRCTCWAPMHSRDTKACIEKPQCKREFDEYLVNQKNEHEAKFASFNLERHKTLIFFIRK